MLAIPVARAHCRPPPARAARAASSRGCIRAVVGKRSLDRGQQLRSSSASSRSVGVRCRQQHLQPRRGRGSNVQGASREVVAGGLALLEAHAAQSAASECRSAGRARRAGAENDTAGKLHQSVETPLASRSAHAVSDRARPELAAAVLRAPCRHPRQSIPQHAERVRQPREHAGARIGSSGNASRPARSVSRCGEVAAVDGRDIRGSNGCRVSRVVPVEEVAAVPFKRCHAARRLAVRSSSRPADR